MAVVTKRLGKGFLPTDAVQTTNLYTVPTGTKTLVKAITFCNGSSGNLTFNLRFAGTPIINTYTIKSYDTITIPFLDQVLESGEVIQGNTTVATTISYYISGKEVT